MLIYFTCSGNDFVTNRIRDISECQVSLIAWISNATNLCPHEPFIVDLAWSHIFLNNMQCLWWSAGLFMQSQQCYRHLLTRYLIFKNVLIVYGIILESTDVTWCSVFIQSTSIVGYSPLYTIQRENFESFYLRKFWKSPAIFENIFSKWLSYNES